MISVNILVPNKKEVLEELKTLTGFHAHSLNHSTNNAFVTVEVSEPDVVFLKLKYGNKNVWPR